MQRNIYYSFYSSRIAIGKFQRNCCLQTQLVVNLASSSKYTTVCKAFCSFDHSRLRPIHSLVYDSVVSIGVSRRHSSGMVDVWNPRTKVDHKARCIILTSIASSISNRSSIYYLTFGILSIERITSISFTHFRVVFTHLHDSLHFQFPLDIVACIRDIIC